MAIKKFNIPLVDMDTQLVPGLPLKTLVDMGDGSGGCYLPGYDVTLDEDIYAMLMSAPPGVLRFVAIALADTLVATITKKDGPFLGQAEWGDSLTAQLVGADFDGKQAVLGSLLAEVGRATVKQIINAVAIARKARTESKKDGELEEMLDAEGTKAAMAELQRIFKG